jgi:hypothetical protein
LGKTSVGRAEEAHVAEALRLSPKDGLAYLWMTHAGIAMNYLWQLRAGRHVVSPSDRGQSK